MVLKKKRFNNTITGGLEPKEFSYSIVRYNYVFIRFDRRCVLDVVEWPGVGGGIRGVLVEYTYVLFTLIFFCNTANYFGTKSGVGVAYTLTESGDRKYTAGVM